MKKGERWKDVMGFEGYYKVSNYGNVVSLARKKCEYCGHQGKKLLFLKCVVPGKSKYKMVVLAKPGGKVKTYTVHRLVAAHFVKGQTEAKKCVNHKDGNKLNNRADNLEWVTISENGTHAIRTGLAKPPEYYNPWVTFNGKNIRVKKCERHKYEQPPSSL